MTIERTTRRLLTLALIIVCIALYARLVSFFGLGNPFKFLGVKQMRVFMPCCALFIVAFDLLYLIRLQRRESGKAEAAAAMQAPEAVAEAGGADDGAGGGDAGDGDADGGTASVSADLVAVPAQTATVVGAQVVDTGGAVTVEPDAALDHAYVMGSMAAQEGDYVSAESFFRKAIESADAVPAVMLNDYADVLKKLRRMEEAEKIARRAIAESDDSLWVARLTLAEILVARRKDPEECRRLCARAVLNAPMNRRRDVKMQADRIGRWIVNTPTAVSG